MTFFKNFKAKNNLQAILYLMGAEILGFGQKLGPLRPFKDGNPHLLPNFATFFQTPITWAYNELFGDFQGSKRSLVVGYQMGAEIFEFRPNLILWRLFKEGN